MGVSREKQKQARVIYVLALSILAMQIACMVLMFIAFMIGIVTETFFGIVGVLPFALFFILAVPYCLAAVVSLSSIGSQWSLDKGVIATGLVVNLILLLLVILGFFSPVPS